MDATLTRLFPTPSASRPLGGAYLAHDLRARGTPGRPFVYANFVSSLDGRTSQIDRELGRLRPPAPISNDHDWRLYQELAAQADAVITSSSRLSAMLAENRPRIECVEGIEEGDIGEWRRARGLTRRPTCIVLSKSLELPMDDLLRKPHCDLVIMAGAGADPANAKRLTCDGVEVRITRQRWVLGADILAMAREREFRTLYVIGGPDILYTMLDARLLDRLYMTVAHLALAGRDFDTLSRGDTLSPPFGFSLNELYLDPPLEGKPELLFASYNRAPAGSGAAAIA